MTDELSTPEQQLKALIARCNSEKDKPSEEDRAALRELLANDPSLARKHASLTKTITAEMLEDLQLSYAAGAALKAELQAIKDGLGYDTATMLEQLLIDSISLCWLRCQIVTLQYLHLAADGQQSLNQGLFWERRMSAVQGRLMRSFEALARVRRLDVRNLQINLAGPGGQQVNVQSDR
jgi:hypothetical protein